MKVINEHELDITIKNSIIPSKSNTITGIISDTPEPVKCEFYENGWHEITATQLHYLMYVASCRKECIDLKVRFTYKGKIIDRDMYSKYDGITEFVLRINKEGALDWNCPSGFLNFDKLIFCKTMKNCTDESN